MVAICHRFAQGPHRCCGPAPRHLKRQPRCRWDRLLFLEIPRLHQPRLLGRDAFQQCRRRFVLWVLRYKAAKDGEVEDGLAELLDLIGALGEGGEVAQREAGVIGESGRVAKEIQRGLAMENAWSDGLGGDLAI